MAYVKRTYQRTSGGHVFTLRNLMAADGKFVADVYVDGKHVTTVTETGIESNVTTLKLDRDLRTAGSRIAFKGPSSQSTVELVSMVLAQEMISRGLGSITHEQREAGRLEDERSRKLKDLKRQNLLLELKVEELRHKMRARHFVSI